MEPRSPGAPEHARRLGGRVALELSVLAAVCAGVFFVGLNRFDFIKTEGLRAIVVTEMLERPGLTMPTVHEAPYLKKPPLYAWTTTLVARAVGRFDEGIARIPAAVGATLFLLALYLAGELWIGRRAGLAAACLGAFNVTVIDYGMRAELDMGFALLSTLTNLLAWPALRSRGARSAVWWLAVYAAATAASFWKGPHALIFLWLMLLAWGVVKRDWRWLRNPGHLAGLVVCLGLLLWWTSSLSAFSGGNTVARAAGRELVSRLIPYKPAAMASVLWYGPAIAVMTLPASLFVIAGLRRGVTGVAEGGLSTRGSVRTCLGRWWAYLTADPFAEFLMCWLVPNLVFDIVAPAKAPRYALAHFGPVFLLAGWVLYRVERSRSLAGSVGKVELAWRGVYSVLGVAGAAALVMAALAVFLPDTGAAYLAPATIVPWLTAGLAAGGAAALEFLGPASSKHPRRLIGLLIVLCALKPVLLTVVWPLRVQSDSMRAVAARIDQIVPDGKVITVLGRHELPDVDFYSRRRFQFLREVTGPSQIRSEGARFCLARENELLELGLIEGFSTLWRFERADRQLVLIDVSPGAIPMPASAQEDS
ncbi:MAG: hypothetical protein GY842_16295 [bacterium]|nr:hypothetical protein [bacterium]